MLTDVGIYVRVASEWPILGSSPISAASPAAETVEVVEPPIAAAEVVSGPPEKPVVGKKAEELAGMLPLGS